MVQWSSTPKGTKRKIQNNYFVICLIPGWTYSSCVSSHFQTAKTHQGLLNHAMCFWPAAFLDRKPLPLSTPGGLQEVCCFLSLFSFPLSISVYHFGFLISERTTVGLFSFLSRTEWREIVSMSQWTHGLWAQTLWKCWSLSEQQLPRVASLNWVPFPNRRVPNTHYWRTCLDLQESITNYTYSMTITTEKCLVYAQNIKARPVVVSSRLIFIFCCCLVVLTVENYFKNKLLPIFHLFISLSLHPLKTWVHFWPRSMSSPWIHREARRNTNKEKCYQRCHAILIFGWILQQGNL